MGGAGRVIVITSVLVAVGSVVACANILGIDDGIPRGDDASARDSSLPDATTLPDVAVDVSDSAMEAFADAPTSPLACGTSACDALTQVCCRMGDPSDASAETFSCVASVKACAGGLAVTCDESANCDALGHPGTECCAVVPDGGSIATSTACVKNGTCAGVVMCRPGDDEVCDADAGETCQASVSTMLGFLICKT
jgi:hypothetical protein